MVILPCLRKAPVSNVRSRTCHPVKFIFVRACAGVIKGGIEVTGRRGRRRRKLLDDLKERTGYSHLKKEALDRTVWRAGFGRGFGPVVRQTENSWYRTDTVGRMVHNLPAVLPQLVPSMAGTILHHDTM